MTPRRLPDVAHLDRRTFLVRAGAGVAVMAAGSRTLRAQDSTAGGTTQSAASNVEMSSDSYKPVRMPAKPGAVKLMDEKQVNEFERKLACPCPCTLDVYTCRTTDFTCGISPSVHRDVQALVDGGYSADEIMTAMLGTYGDFILMEPRKQGFNLLAWIAPFTALGVGAIAIGAMLRGWRRNADDARAEDARSIHARAADTGAAEGAPAIRPVSAVPGVDATQEELAALEAALKDDRR
jgi:cytochrome c-type biogenesis protein CcmH